MPLVAKNFEGNSELIAVFSILADNTAIDASIITFDGTIDVTPTGINRGITGIGGFDFTMNESNSLVQAFEETYCVDSTSIPAEVTDTLASGQTRTYASDTPDAEQIVYVTATKPTFNGTSKEYEVNIVRGETYRTRGTRTGNTAASDTYNVIGKAAPVDLTITAALVTAQLPFLTNFTDTTLTAGTSQVSTHVAV